MSLPRVHIKTLSGCEGCQDELEHKVLELLLTHLNIVEARLITSPIDTNILPGDVVIFEGAPNNREHIEELKKIRALPGVIIIQMGTCASTGGIQGAMSEETLEEVANGEWGEYNQALGLVPGAPVSHYITVDDIVPGCPVNPFEFAEHVAKLLSGGKPREYTHAVCAKCPRVGCLLNEEIFCAGMISAAGCYKTCPEKNDGCRACRGFLKNADVPGFIAMLVQKGFSEYDVRQKLSIYNTFALKNLKKEGGNV
jgi:coenzyme F420-reducing hydrogenase gamma subunit